MKKHDRRLRRALRASGMSLIEAMVSMAILTFGLLGALQGVLIASKQNSLAARMSRASAVAGATRGALQRKGLQVLAADGRVVPSTLAPSTHTGVCSTSMPAASSEFAKLFDITASNACWIDLDAPANAALASWLVEGYSAADLALYNRQLFLVPLVDPDSTGVASGMAFGVGVFSKGSGKALTKQFTVLYNRSVNSAAIDL